MNTSKLSHGLLWLCLALTGCASQPALRVQHIEFGSSIWSNGQRQAGVIFQDWAQSTTLPGGSLWTFGDTFVGRPLPGRPPQNPQIIGMIGNTIAFLPAGETNLPPRLSYFTNALGLATNPLTLFPEEPAAIHRIWPLGGIGVGSRCYLFYSMIEKTDGQAPWNFRSVGAGLAVAEQPWQTFTRLRPDGRWQFPMEPAQVIREGSWLYLYEISTHPQGLILARVPVAQIENPTAYAFLTEQGWSTNRAQAKVILRQAYGQVSIVWNTRRHCYLMATSGDFSHPEEIQLRQASRPDGPWSPPVRIAIPAMPGKQTSLIYCTFLHPALSDDRALRYVVTYCRTLTGDWELANPEWLTITLAP